MTELFISDGRRYCLMCRKPIPDDMVESIHPVPCQEEMDKFIIPEMMELDFSQFFRRMTEFALSPTQEQMYLLLENQENRYRFDRCDGKTTLLTVYIIYKALHTPNNWGILLCNDNMDQYVDQLMKKMLLRLDFAEARNLDIEPFEDMNRDRHFRLPNTLRLDTFTTKDLRRTMNLTHHNRVVLFSKFNKFVTTVRGQSGQWTIIADPLFYPTAAPETVADHRRWNYELATRGQRNRRNVFW